MLQAIELARQRLSLSNDVGQHRTVFALQSLDQRESIFDFLQPRGRSVDTFTVAAQDHRQIFELRLDGLARSRMRLEYGIDLCELCHALPNGAQPGEHRIIAFVQDRIRFATQPLKPVCVAQHPPGRLELFILGRSQVCLLELVQLERQQIAARESFALVELECPELLFNVFPPPEGRTHLFAQRHERRKVVQDGEVASWIEQSLMLMLPVQLDEWGHPLVQRGSRDERVIDKCAAASLRSHIATHDALSAGDVEDCLNRRLRLPRPDQVSRGTSPHQKPERLHQHRLSCSGFSCEDVEARSELELQLVDDGEMLNTKEAKHQRRPASP